jgi:hypothetical protein
VRTLDRGGRVGILVSVEMKVAVERLIRMLVAQALACDFLIHADPGKNHRLKPVPLQYE